MPYGVWQSTENKMVVTVDAPSQDVLETPKIVFTKTQSYSLASSVTAVTGKLVM